MVCRATYDSWDAHRQGAAILAQDLSCACAYVGSVAYCRLLSRAAHRLTTQSYFTLRPESSLALRTCSVIFALWLGLRQVVTHRLW